MDTATAVSSSATPKNAAAKSAAKSGSTDFMAMIAAQMTANKAAFNTRQAANVKVATAQDALDSLDAKGLEAKDLADLPDDLQKLLHSLLAQAQADPSAVTAMATAKPGPVGADAAQKILADLSPAGRQKLLAALQSLVNGLPAAARPTIETLENGVLRPLDGQNLVADGGKADAASNGATALIVSGLSPQQLTALMKQVKDGDTTAPSSAAGQALATQITLIQLTPVASKKDALPAARTALPGAGRMQPPQKTDAAQTAAPPDAGQASGGKQDAGDPDAAKAADMGDAIQSSTMTAVRPDVTGLPQKSGGFEHILKMFETARQDQSSGQPVNAAPKTDITAGASAVAASTLVAAGGADSSLTGTTLSLDPSALPSLQVQGLPAPTATMAALTNLTTASPQAIYSHPAAVQLAASISSQFKANGDTSLVLRLDPPDLGHVSVKMEFRDDKTVKAVVSADKPETFLMMQRDAHILQKAFDDAGLNTGGNGLTFELSQDGSAFGQQNRQGNAYAGGKNGGQGDDAGVIETTMDWSVDAVGAWHYDALA